MKPNLIIIGAMKSGTSSLHHYLNLHPEIFMSTLKELDYFILEKNWQQGSDWYESQFSCNDSNIKIYGESSPNYTKAHLFAGVPERIFKTLPNAKLIYILRDPIKRTLSHYYHQAVDSQENRTLIDAISAMDSNYVQTSLYYQQIQPFLKFYDPQQLIILSLEELEKNPLKVLPKVFQFLGVDSSFCHSDFLKRHHLSADKRKINDIGRLISKLPFGLRLCNFFPKLFTEKITYPELTNEVIALLNLRLGEDVALLREMTNQSFSDWML